MISECVGRGGVGTANVSVCAYVGGGSVVGGRAAAASASSWDATQATPVSLGREQSSPHFTTLSVFIIYVDL